jgi:hypothetical protein
MRILIIGGFLILGIVALTLIPSNADKKINGVSLVSPHSKIGASNMAEVKRINAGWVAVIPYAFSRSGEPSVSFDHERQWWGERTEGTCELIKMAKENGLKVMLKPHVWVRGEGWTGDFKLSSEEQWKEWESHYSNYILNYANVADRMGVEMLCIGTEYRTPAKERPEFWKRLTKEIRAIYGGKITYASNWDNYENITWWSEVDYIGIDAYFPLAEGANPTMEEIREGWNPLKQNLSAFSKKWKKPILFTEYGFQSADGAAGKHWVVIQSEEGGNQELQANAYEATFQALNKEEWFAGGFLWKWHFDIRNDRIRPTAWTPQGKQAEQVIAKWYAKME